MRRAAAVLVPLALLPLSACGSTRTAPRLSDAEAWARQQRDVTLRLADGSAVRVRDLRLRSDTSWAFVPGQGVVRTWPTADIRSVEGRDVVVPLVLGSVAGLVAGWTMGRVAGECRSFLGACNAPQWPNHLNNPPLAPRLSPIVGTALVGGLSALIGRPIRLRLPVGVRADTAAR